MAPSDFHLSLFEFKKWSILRYFLMTSYQCNDASLASLSHRPDYELGIPFFNQRTTLFKKIIYCRFQIDELERIRRSQQLELDDLISSKDASGKF